MNLDNLLRTMVSKGASDLHLKAGASPNIRVNGELVPLGESGKLSKEDTLMFATNPDEFKLRVQGIYATRNAAMEAMESELSSQDP